MDLLMSVIAVILYASAMQRFDKAFDFIHLTRTFGLCAAHMNAWTIQQIEQWEPDIIR